VRGALSKEIENGSKEGWNSCLGWFFVFVGGKKRMGAGISGGGPPWAHEAGWRALGGGRALHPRGNVVGPPGVFFVP